MEKEKTQLSTQLKQIGYPIVLVAKAVLLAVSIFGILVITRDLTAEIVGISAVVAFIVCLISAYGTRAILMRIFKKNTADCFVHFLLADIVIVVVLIAIASFIPTTTRPILLSLTAGFIGGTTFAELIYVRRV